MFSEDGNGGAILDRSSGALAFRAQLVVPEQRQLYDYWLEIAAGHAVPLRTGFNPVRLPRLLQGISLIDVDEDVRLCRVRLAGTRLREIYDCEITGLNISDVPSSGRQDYWLAAYRRTIEHATPTQGVIQGPMVNKEHVVQYWMKLPMRTTGEGVGVVLCYDHFMLASELGVETDARMQAVS